MKFVYVIFCISCLVKFGEVSSAIVKDESRGSELRESVTNVRANDLEGSETSAKFFNLASLFPSYTTKPSYYPGGYPTTGGGYYPTSGAGGSFYPSQGYYPSSSYPTGTNILGTGYGGYPTQSFYPSYGYSRTGGYNTRTSGYDGGYGGSSGYGGSRGYSGYGGYGGYGGNGGLSAYNGYYNTQYNGKRNLGYGYYSDTDRFGFYRSPSEQLSVNRGYN